MTKDDAADPPADADPIAGQAPTDGAAGLEVASPQTAEANLTRTSLLLTIARWLREGARSSLLLPPRWNKLDARPALILSLSLWGLCLSLLLQRLSIVGPASFDWQPLLAGWLLPAATAWVCYLLHHPADGQTAASAPTAPQLFCLIIVQGSLIGATWWIVWVIIIHLDDGRPQLSPALQQVLWLTAWGWLGAAQTLALWRGARRKTWAPLMAALLLALAIVDNHHEQRRPWIAEAEATHEERPTWLRVTQELMEQQIRLLDEQLAALKPQRPGIVDLYVLTFAPYAHEEVFRRESALVADVMQQRFDSSGRTLQLVNHVATADETPWATPLNLQRAIQRISALMDRNEDILFIHLTSHGAENGELAAEFWPLTVAKVTPQQLKAWLDEAGIRHRVVSVSACYSGSWIEPLADSGTLVMTAADADHTSYGCGRRSELTFFGRAVYDEQLRHHTRSFELAHAAARPVIEQREREAGKDDGYSNPRIAVGDGIRAPLDKLRQRFEGG